MDVPELIASARSLHGRPFEEVTVDFGSLAEMLQSRAVATPHDPWLIFYGDNRKRLQLSFGEFRDRVQRVAGFLHDRQMGPGVRIATFGHNHVDTVVQYFASWWIGATVVPLNMSEDDERLGYILNNAEVSLAFVRSEYYDRASAIAAGVQSLRDLVICGERVEGLASFDDAIEHPSLAEPFTGPLDAECLIVYTSGTTGQPKGVVLAHGNLLADADGITRWHGITSGSRMMCVLPVHHVNGTVVTLVSPMYAGASVVLNRKFHTDEFFPRVASEGVGIVSVVPTLLAYLVQADVDLAAFDLSKFRHIICGAGPLTCELADRFESRYGIPIVHGYGLSETTCYSCFLPAGLPDGDRRAWLTAHGFPSIGVPIPQNEMAIHDGDGRPVAAGERGEIVIRGHNVMKEYYRNPQANASAFAHGWFRSGDEGFWLESPDARPYFFITGRLKELIIRGGVNISPLEIDEVINRHPKVEAGIAVGFENNWYGEEVGAYVRPIDSSLTEAAFLAYCRTLLPWFKAPKVVVFGDEIPVTSTGKYQRNRVRPLFDAWRDTQFSQHDRAKM